MPRTGTHEGKLGEPPTHMSPAPMGGGSWQWGHSTWTTRKGGLPPYHRTATWVGTPVRPIALVSNGGTSDPTHVCDPSPRNPAAHMCRPAAGPIAAKQRLANLQCAGPLSCEKESYLRNERTHACAPCSSGGSVYNLR